MATTAPSEYTQVIAYLKRNPSFTREQFYQHWTEKHAPLVVPLFIKAGVIRYQQIQTSGTVIPNQPATSTTSGVDASLPEHPEPEPIEFDGIAMTYMADPSRLLEVISSDPYYTDVVQLDERRMLDGDAPGHGIVARFMGRCVTFDLANDATEE